MTAIIFVFIIGTAVGSFINVLESRLYKGEDIFRIPSHCDYCKKRLRWVDLVPVLSWVLYCGRSRCCHKKLSWQYPIVELVTGLGFVVIYLRENIAALLHCFIAGNELFRCLPIYSLAMQQWNNETIIFFVIFVIAFTILLQDLKYQAIRSSLLWILLTVTLAYKIIRPFLIFLKFYNLQFTIYNLHLEVAFFSALPFYLLYKLSHEKWLGEGDVWIAGWMGLFLGWPKTFYATYFGLIAGGAVSAIALLLKLKKLRDTISLGPFLLIGVLIVLFLPW